MSNVIEEKIASTLEIARILRPEAPPSAVTLTPVRPGNHPPAKSWCAQIWNGTEHLDWGREAWGATAIEAVEALRLVLVDVAGGAARRGEARRREDESKSHIVASAKSVL